jgi:hypothetical protein
LCFFANASVQALPTIVANELEEHLSASGESPHEGLIASSTLAPQCKGKCLYYVQNLADGDESTAWVEGKRGYGIGQYVEFYQTVNNSTTDSTLFMMNGYQKPNGSWIKNTRVRKLKLYVNSNLLAHVELLDVMGWQSFVLYSLKSRDRRLKLRFEIAAIYPGSKWKDTAISEMKVECY